MSTKTNTNRGGKKSKGFTYSGKGMGMRKHARSGISHNHTNSINRAREYNKEQERINELKSKRKGRMFSSVKEVFEQK